MFANTFKLVSLISTNGNLSSPASNPIKFIAALTGIGLTSINKELTNSFKLNCNFLASSISPDRYFSTISWVSLGNTLAKTDITPLPPRDSIGTIWSSFPLYIAKSSPHNLDISATWLISPLASFIATIFLTLDNFSTVVGFILTPVLPGTL